MAVASRHAANTRTEVAYGHLQCTIQTDPLPSPVDPLRVLLYRARMKNGPDMHDLVRRVAVMEERMQKLRVDLAATLAGMRADMATHREDAAKRDIDAANAAARRDKDNLRWQIGLWVGAAVIVGILIRWPAS